MTVLGCDISHWNGNMDFQTMYNAGARFIMVRAGSVDAVTGVSYKDYRFDENMRKILDFQKVAPLPYTSYWYFRPQHDPTIQARFWANVVRPYGFKSNHVLDVEINGYVTSSGAVIPTVPIYTFASRVASICTTMKQETGFFPEIYTRKTFWDANVAANTLWNSLGLHAARWVADPNNITLTSPWSDGLYKFRDWQTWKYWQFSADGNGLGRKFGSLDGDLDMDLNFYNGSIDDLYKLFGISQGVGYANNTLEYLNSIDSFLRELGYTNVKPPLNIV